MMFVDEPVAFVCLQTKCNQPNLIKYILKYYFVIQLMSYSYSVQNWPSSNL